MDLTDVMQIIEKRDITDVNKHLDCGWVLLALAPGNWPDGNEPYIIYSIGWLKGSTPVFPKDDSGLF